MECWGDLVSMRWFWRRQPPFGEGSRFSCGFPHFCCRDCGLPVRLVNKLRGFVAQSPVRTLGVVTLDPLPDSGLQIPDCRVAYEIDVLVFQTPPEPLDAPAHT